ncbi:Crp/Fnr family transcriptional regulator [Marinobacter sp. 71-i]|uniref:Crp/Fnr family transcriptional regulator n=1 Tax=Marinobacter iranensis TaxID=2962607 RepID=A0ABT5YAQ1_9GAMM|nr:Crp/Fnr family transcriptional regulator [Marinobacter iranensis]MDF0750765.1 Crp/Fnr family transcriptional regulator [Marinobacter iranensis]
MQAGRNQNTNAIIAVLPGQEGRRFISLCDSAELSRGDVLCESNHPLRTAYFPTSGVISLAMALGALPPLQLGLIGRDGMLGATLPLDTLAAPLRAVVQIAGTAMAMPVAQLQQELRASPRLLEAVNHYQFRLMMQTLQTAACMHFHEIEPRLARWLLMIQDLSFTDKVQFTHELLSHALGVRRSGITLAAGSLQRQGLIRYSRGEIHILDHPGLEAAACECHEVLNDKYRAVFG